MWDNYKVIKEKINEIKSQCDYCVVVVHGGEEFTQIPLPYARKRYKKYLKFGADYVVGHHPHVPQNYESFGSKIIFYSLGNFIFDTDYQRQQRNTDIGVLLKLKFEKGNSSFSSLSTKIDRENCLVVDTEPLFIFQDIDEKTYNKIIAYADMDFSKNLKRKFDFLKQTKKTRTKLAFFKSKLKRFKFRDKFWIYKMLVLRLFKPWKKADKNMLDYLDGGKKD